MRTTSAARVDDSGGPESVPNAPRKISESFFERFYLTQPFFVRIFYVPDGFTITPGGVACGW